MGFSDEMKAYFLWPYQFVRTLDVGKTDSTTDQLASSKALDIESVSQTHINSSEMMLMWRTKQNRTNETDEIGSRKEEIVLWMVP